MEFDRILLAEGTKRIDAYVVDKAGIHRADSQRGLLEVHDPFFVLRLDCKSKNIGDWIYEVMQLVYRPQVEYCWSHTKTSPYIIVRYAIVDSNHAMREALSFPRSLLQNRSDTESLVNLWIY